VYPLSMGIFWFFRSGMKRDYPPNIIDVAVIATIQMLNRGKAVAWQGSRMYCTRRGTCLDGEIVGDAVDATFLWFERYSKANPYKSNWGENRNTIEFLKRRFT